MLKLIEKLKLRYSQFVNRPLVNYPLFSLLKYIYINIRLRINNKPIIVTWFNGLKYYLSLGDCGGIIGNYYFHLQDINESIFLVRYLTKNDTFVDVGSNHGHYTLLSGGICGTRTISVEPVKKTYHRLYRNVELNKLDNVVLYNLGISEKEDELFFSNDKGPMNMVVSQTSDCSIEKVKVTTLDNLLNLEENVSVLKIDVESYEKQVLIGGKNLLKNNNLNVIIIELYYGIGEEEVLKILKENGFYPYKYDYMEKILHPLKTRNFESFNTIFVKNIDLVMKRLNQKSLKIEGNKIIIN